ncbi:hypothetical protein CN155_25430 [Sinorhizobium meliloti]|nr:hypothetical protein CN155_25430 [Sinorhizobium meliloti]
MSPAPTLCRGWAGTFHCFIETVKRCNTVCGVHAPLIFQLRRSEADPRRSNELTEEYLTSSL